jgi:prepilin-type processing-associated H-X9-DG protein
VISDGVVVIGPPQSIVVNQLFNSKAVIFPERTDVTMSASLQVALGSGTVPAGTTVDSYTLHYDPPGKVGTVRNVSVSFTNQILGVIATTSAERATDSLLGSPSTAYDETDSARGFESNTDVGEISSDRLTYKIDSLSVNQHEDECRIITLPGGICASSNGMNNHASKFVKDSNTLLLVEYNLVVANLVGSSATDVWTDQVAPRHSGILNVLFADGHVDGRTPDSVDPRNADLYNTFWRPVADPTH